MSKIIYKKFITSIALLSMGMAFLAQISPIWLKNANGTPMVICTAFGYETITIDENGNEIPSKPNSIKNNCVICLNASAYFDLPKTALASHAAPSQQTSKLRWYTAEYTAISTSYSAEKPIRAPPQFS